MNIPKELIKKNVSVELLDLEESIEDLEIFFQTFLEQVRKNFKKLEEKLI